MSFQQGISGLNATSKSLDVIGNNIANAGTVGAKSSRIEFADMYSSALGGVGSKQAGVGVAVAAVAQSFSQGSITSTSNPLDMAISGNGFFQVRTADNQTNYTRNGQFKIDRDGYVVNNQGHMLLGDVADASGQIVSAGEAQTLKLDLQPIEPAQTTKLTVQGNLNSLKVDPTAAFDPTDATTYNDATSINAIDANGKQVAVTLYFRKDSTATPTNPKAAAVWTVYATANGQLAGNPAGSAVATLEFDSAGAQVAQRPASPTLDIPSTTVSPGIFTLPMSPAIDLSGFTQYASTFGVTKVDADGYTSGSLTGVAVESTGIVRANYSNGQSKAIGQVQLATFQNPNGLRPIGGNEWVASVESGNAATGKPGTGNLGELQTSAVEESNVDLTGELVNMIIAQRVYQANAQTIKTQDQLLQTLVSLR